MLNTIIKTSLVIMILGVLLSARVSANSAISGIANLTNSVGWESVLSELPIFSIKRGIPYDESKDPALRKGTENMEQPQHSYFIMPIALFVGVGLFLYFNKL